MTNRPMPSAVALGYEVGTPAPRVLAQGRGEVAGPEHLGEEPGTELLVHVPRQGKHERDAQPTLDRANAHTAPSTITVAPEPRWIMLAT